MKFQKFNLIQLKNKTIFFIQNMRINKIMFLDVVSSILLMSSYLYASLYGEKFNESIQFNLINILVGGVSGVIGYKKQLYGLTMRQMFFVFVFVFVSCLNLTVL